MKWYCSFMGIGAGTGAIGGYMAAKDAGLNPWTGKANNPKPSIVIGRDMDNRVNPAAKDLGAKTISNDWNNHFGEGTNVHPDVGVPFNQGWIEIQIEQNIRIYDIGTGGNPTSSPYYNIELNTIQNMNYQNVTPTYYIHYRQTIRIIYHR